MTEHNYNNLKYFQKTLFKFTYTLIAEIIYVDDMKSLYVLLKCLDAKNYVCTNIWLISGTLIYGSICLKITFDDLWWIETPLLNFYNCTSWQEVKVPQTHWRWPTPGSKLHIQDFEKPVIFLLRFVLFSHRRPAFTSFLLTPLRFLMKKTTNCQTQCSCYHPQFQLRPMSL